MRKLAIGFMAMALVLCTQVAMAQVVGVGRDEQPQTSKEKAQAASKAAVEKVLKFAQVRNYEGLGKMSVYAGKEPNRAMKSKVNLQDPYERVELQNTTNLIYKILDQTVIWNATNFKEINSLNSKYYYWDVEFTDDKARTRVYNMLFVELGGEMLFARIEKKGTVKTD